MPRSYRLFCRNGEGKEVFFFEKKKQKTFACGVRRFVQPANPTLPVTSKSFLLLFFKKEVFLFFHWARRPQTPISCRSGWGSCVPQDQDLEPPAPAKTPTSPGRETPAAGWFHRPRPFPSG